MAPGHEHHHGKTDLSQEAKCLVASVDDLQAAASQHKPGQQLAQNHRKMPSLPTGQQRTKQGHQADQRQDREAHPCSLGRIQLQLRGSKAHWATEK